VPTLFPAKQQHSIATKNMNHILQLQPAEIRNYSVLQCTTMQFEDSDDNYGVQDMYSTLVDLVLLNTFQKRRVSSPAPVTIDSPSGDIACAYQPSPFTSSCITSHITC